jgi:predicted flap endonuclease-1-like 5' DNA nuclease
MASKKDKNYYSKGGRGGRAEIVSGPLAGEYKLPEEEKELREAATAARKAVSAEDQASGLKGRRLADRKEKRETASKSEATESNDKRKQDLIKQGAWRTSPLLSSGEDTVATKKDTKKPTAKKEETAKPEAKKPAAKKKNATDAAVERMNDTAEKEKAKPKKPSASKNTPAPKSTPVVNDDGGMPKGTGPKTEAVVNDDGGMPKGKGPQQVPRSDSSGNTVDLNRFNKKPKKKNEGAKDEPAPASASAPAPATGNSKYDSLTPEQKAEYDDLRAQGYSEISPRKSEDSGESAPASQPRGDGKKFILNGDKSGKSEPVYGTADEAKANAERIRKLRDMKETGKRDTTPKPQSAPASEPATAPEAEPTKPSFGSRIRGWIAGSGGKGGAPTAGAGAPPNPPRPTSGSGGAAPPPPPGGGVKPGGGSYPPPAPPTGGGSGGFAPPAPPSGGGGNTYAPQNTSKNYGRNMNGAVVNDTSSNNAFQGNNNTFGNNSFNAGNIGGGGMAISTGGNATTDGPGMAVSTGGNAHVRGHNATRQGRPTTNNPRTQQP